MPFGEIVHNEIKVKDIGKAKKFYGKLFGWKFKPAEEGYVTYETPGDGWGGLELTKEKICDGPVVFYVSVADIPKTIKKAKTLGGKLEMDKTIIGDGEWGYYAFLRDPSGNKVGVWSMK